MGDIIQNFVCIGAQKAGTTTLADILSQHPEICIPPIKETKFFLFEEDYNRGQSFYNSYFSNYSGQKAVGEFDPDYLLFPFTADCIAETLGLNIKILVVLRNPADRAYSHFLMTKKKGLEPFGFLEGIEAEPSRKGDIKTRKIFGYIERGLYGGQISAFMKVFPAANFMFMVFEEDFLTNRTHTISRVQSFLGVAQRNLNLNVHSNEAGESRNEVIRDLVRKPNFAKKVLKIFMPSSAVRKNLRNFFIIKNQKKAKSAKLENEMRRKVIEQYFIEDIRFTEKLIKRDLSVWYK